MGEELSRRLTERDDMLSYVFTLLGHGKTCITACQFLEDLLQARREVLNLASIRECPHSTSQQLYTSRVPTVLVRLHYTSQQPWLGRYLCEIFNIFSFITFTHI